MPKRQNIDSASQTQKASAKLREELPRASKYDRHWALANSLGENVLFNAESLCKALGLRRGMKVLDLGCGNAVSSIFIAREFKCQVWAVDNQVPVRENLERIRMAKMERSVIPIQCDARALPFPKGFFDRVIAVDSYMYYGTDPEFLPYILEFLKQPTATEPGGQIGVLDACFTREVTHESKAPGFLKRAVRSIFRRMHSIRWWKRLWERTGLVRVIRAEEVENSDALLSEFVRSHKTSEEEKEVVDLVKKDKRHFIKLFRMIAERK